jgi:hypothetical protein
MSTAQEKREKRFCAWWVTRGYRKLCGRLGAAEYERAFEFIKFGWMEHAKEQG